MAIQESKNLKYSDQKINLNLRINSVANLNLFAINHKTAPVAIREKFAIPDYKLKDAIQELKTYKLVESFLILSTCNRTEIYFTSKNRESSISEIYKFLSKFLSMEEEITKEYNSVLNSTEVVEHVFKLACGLESLIIGEKQVLSQLKFAYSKAQEEKTLDNTLELLFQNAINSAKEIHKNTNLSTNSPSISSAAIDLANSICGPIKTKSIMILGAGKMAELALDHIEEIGGAKETVVLNRSPHRVIEFSDKYKIDRSIPFDDIYSEINETDIIITATGAPHFILFAEKFKSLRKDSSKPLHIFDISLPRNVDPEFRNLENIKLLDIDSLQTIYSNNTNIPSDVLKKVEDYITNGIKDFSEEVSSSETNTLIKDLKTKVNNIIEEKLSKLKSNSNINQEELEYIVNNIANTIIHSPVKNLKNSKVLGSKEEKLQLIRDLFEI